MGSSLCWTLSDLMYILSLHIIHLTHVVIIVLTGDFWPCFVLLVLTHHHDNLFVIENIKKKHKTYSTCLFLFLKAQQIKHSEGAELKCCLCLKRGNRRHLAAHHLHRLVERLAACRSDTTCQKSMKLSSTPELLPYGAKISSSDQTRKNSQHLCANAYKHSLLLIFLYFKRSFRFAVAVLL